MNCSIIDISGVQDYYPFGSLMPGRHTITTSSEVNEHAEKPYRFGFNGMEKDFEVKRNTGSHYDFGARVYDSRLGRFFSGDPWEAKYSWQSPYVYGANNPIFFLDKDGKGPVPFKSLLTQNTSYGLGLAYGIGDGVIELAEFSRLLNFSDVSPEKIKMVAGMYQAGKLVVAMSSDAELREKIGKNLAEAMEVVYKDAKFANGDGKAGYIHGKIVFEAILTAATAGGSSAKSTITALKSGGDKLVDVLRRIKIDRAVLNTLNSGPNPKIFKIASKFQSVKTQWGWSGTQVWKGMVKKVRENTGTLNKFNDLIPTQAEAKQLIKEAVRLTVLRDLMVRIV
jgi:RHS repeat-associated protein